ncbi:MAG: HEAT repeat domain-containing protein [bacterium]
MKHDKYKEWIQLAVFGELTDVDRRALEAHIEDCAECRAEYDELTRLMTLVGETRTVESDEALLVEARKNLREAVEREAAARDDTVRHARSPAALWRRLVGGMPGSVSRSDVSPAGSATGLVGWLQGGAGRVALAGTAAVAVGFIAGYLAFGRISLVPGSGAPPTLVRTADPSSGLDQELGVPSYENVRFVDVDPRSGQVKLEYDLVRPVRLEADIQDESVQRMLAYAVLNEKNPGVKLRAIQTIDAYVERPADEQVKQALIKALKTDPSAGVRKQALYVLYKMKFDQDIKDACLFVLANDQNPGMRVAAINILAAATLEGLVTGEEVYDVLAEQAGEDDFLRARQGAFMQEVNGNGE